MHCIHCILSMKVPFMGILPFIKCPFLPFFGSLFPYFLPPFSPSLSFLLSTQVSEFPISNSRKLLVE